MQLPEFVFIDPVNFPGAGLILYTEMPHYLGRVVKYKPSEFAALNKGVFAQCEGFSIVIQEMEGLLGHRATQSALSDMANFYLTVKILPNLGYYKKFKI